MIKKFHTLLLLLFLTQKLFATHIVGGEMIVTWMNGDNYKITLKVYRDCYNGQAPFDDPLTVSVFNDLNDWLYDIMLTSPAITNLPPNTFNVCLSSPPNVCVEQAIYETVENFPPISGGYRLGYMRCCRNNSIINIQNPGGTGACYTETIADPALAVHNSSPRFNLFPPIVVCANHLLTFNHAATDPNGDQLVYSLCNSYAGFSSTSPGPGTATNPPFPFVQYQAPYSWGNPMGGAPAMSINATTGLLSVFPTTMGQFVVGVCVKEYRNGNLIGTHVRDFQFNVVQCIQTINANFSTSATNLHGCVGVPIVFTNQSTGTNSYLWKFGDNTTSTLANPSHTYAGPGTYQVSLIAGPGLPCADTAHITITIHPIPNSTATVNSPICVGSIIHLTTPTVANAIYNWTGPAGFSSNLQNPNINNAQFINSGTYTLHITVNGCTSPPINVTVAVNPIPVAPTIGSNSPVCTGQNINLTCATVTGASYSWTSSTGFTSSQKNPMITNAQASNGGTYFCTVTVNGCISPPSNLVVNIIQSPLAPVASNNAPFCAGQTLQLNASNVTGTTYHWTGPNGFNSTLQNPAISNAQVNMAGTYSVFVTAANGCNSTIATTNVIILSIPVVTASSNSPVCAGQPINFSANFIQNATYTWSGPNGFTSSIINPVINNSVLTDSGNYSVILNLNGCPSVTSVTHVIVNPIPLAPVNSSNSPVCTGQQIIFNTQAVAGASYSWSGPGGWTSASQNPVRNNAQMSMNGTYTEIVTVNGCPSPPSVTNVIVNQTPAPAISVTQPVCVGQTISLTTPTVANATYLWSGPNGWNSNLQNPVINNLTLNQSGIYSLVVTVSGCSNLPVNSNVVVTPIPGPPVITGSSPVCSGQPINFTAQNVTNGSFSWTGPNSWSSALQNPVINNSVLSQSGNYVATVTVNGCTGPPSNVNITVNQTPAAPVVNTNAPLCEALTLMLNANTIANATYSWTGPNGFSSSQQNPMISNVLLTNAGNYSVTATVNGCTSIPTTIAVGVYQIPTSPFTVTTPVCSGQNVTIQYSGNATSNATYNWNFAGGTIVSGNGAGPYQVSWNAGGSYNVTLDVSENGCNSLLTSQTIQVLQTPGSSFTLQTPICLYDSSQVLFTGINQGNAVFIWNFGNANPPSGTGAGPYFLSYSNTGVQTVALTVTENGCTSPVTTHSIFVNPIPTSSFILVPPVICPGKNTLGLYTGNNSSLATYVWIYAGGTVQGGNGKDSMILNYSDPGSYVVSLSVAEFGCISPITSQPLFVDSLPIPDFVTDDTLGCAPYFVEFTNLSHNGVSYLWSFGNESSSTDPDPSHVFGVGIYSVTLSVTNVNGCRASITYNQLITVLPAPEAIFTVSPEPYKYVELQDATYLFENFSNNATHYLWHFGEYGNDTSTVVSPVHVFSDTGFYDVMLIAYNDIGCTDTAIIGPLTIIPKANYFIPNAFTPNDDGVNDIFFVYGQSLKSVSIQVFDRWGNKVFESDDQHSGWNGTFQGKNMNTSVFMYVGEIETLAGRKFKVKGDVTLIR